MTTPKDPGAEGEKPRLSLVTTLEPPPKALTTKQEAFAVSVASGMDPASAFLKAYTWNGKAEGVATEAGKLMRNARVANRVQELRDRYATTVVEASRGKPAETPARAYGVAEAMTEIDQMVEVAKSKENPMAMGKAIELRMKLYGLGVSDAKNPADKDGMEPEEIEQSLKDLRAMMQRMKA